MNIIEKLIRYIKNLFNKQNEIKLLEEPKEKINANQKSDFINSLKFVDTSKILKKKKIETLVCPGDGLGIQGKIGC